MLDRFRRSPLYAAAWGSYGYDDKRKAVIALCDAGADPNLGDPLPLKDKDVDEKQLKL